MKTLLLIFCLFSLSAWAQDPAEYLKLFDAKVYSLRTNSIKDFAVDISSSRLTKQMNENGTFGKVKELVFKVYWTASPERLEIDIYGLPEGFREVKDELRNSIMPLIEDLLPPSTEKRFAGYKITQGPGSKEFTAKDPSGVAPIPSFILKFDAEDKLSEIVGQKFVGLWNQVPTYKKESFSNGKWVLKKSVTTSSENGQTLIVTKTLNYGSVGALHALTNVSVSTEQKWDKPDTKPISGSESLDFTNYKIDQGVAMKYFLKDAKVP